MNIEDALKTAAVSTREQLQLIESISEFTLEISISGRTHDGDLKIEFELKGGWADRSPVKGGRLDAVVKEFLRRNGWDSTHAPLCLSFAPSTDEVTEGDGAQEDEKVPF